VSGGVQGQYMPEPLMTGREGLYDLSGLQWRTWRPRRHTTEIRLEE